MQDLRELFIQYYIDEIIYSQIYPYGKAIDNLGLTFEERGMYIILNTKKNPRLRDVLAISKESLEEVIIIILSLYIKINQSEI